MNEKSCVISLRIKNEGTYVKLEKNIIQTKVIKNKLDNE